MYIGDFDLEIDGWEIEEITPNAEKGRDETQAVEQQKEIVRELTPQGQEKDETQTEEQQKDIVRELTPKGGNVRLCRSYLRTCLRRYRWRRW